MPDYQTFPMGEGGGVTVDMDETLPKLKDPGEISGLKPGSFFLDPTGAKRQKPFELKEPKDIADIPEGSHFVGLSDPTKAVRMKPKTDPLGVGTQILYSMAGEPRLQKDILAATYGQDNVVQQPDGSVLVRQGDKWLKPGRGFVGPVLGSVAGGAAPGLGALGAGAAGGAVGELAGPVGSFALGAASAGIGARAGQAFNDMILGMAGFSSTEEEEARRLNDATMLGAAGEGAGRIVGAAVPGAIQLGKAAVGKARSLVGGGAGEAASNALPALARKVFGAGAPELKQAVGILDRAKEIGIPDMKIRPSAWAFEAPYIKKVVEEFDPVFRSQEPIKQSAAQLFVKEGGRLAHNLGIELTSPLLSPTAAVEVETAGLAIKERLAKQLQLANDSLRAAVDARQAELETTRFGQAAERESSLSVLQAAQADFRATAQRAVDEAFADVQRSTQAAMVRAGAEEHPADLWRRSGEQLNKIHIGIEGAAKRGYQSAYSAAGPTPVLTGGVVQAATDFLDTIPAEFRSAMPDLVRGMENLTKPRGTGVLGMDGKEIMAIPDITLEQAHNLRNLARARTNRSLPYADELEGKKRFAAGLIDRWMHDRAQPPAVRAGVGIIDQWDRYYAKNIGKFHQEAIQTIAEKAKSGFVEDAPALAKLLFDPSSTVNRENARKLLGPTLWQAAQAADARAVIDASRDLTGAVDTETLVRQVVSRLRSGVWQGSDLGPRVAEYARRLATVEGRIPVEARPGDTLSTVLARASAYEEEVKRLSKVDPIGLLEAESKKWAQQGKAAERTLGREAKAQPLGFALESTVGEIEAAERILRSHDLMSSVYRRFGPDSNEFTLLRKAYAERLLRVSGEGVERTAGMLRELQSIPESVQDMIFPGVTKQEAITLAQNMRFLLGGTGETFGGGMAAASRVINPVPEVRHLTGSHSLGHYMSMIPGGSFAARFTLGKYYQAMTWGFTHPNFIRWMARGLEEGTPAEKEVVRSAFRQAVGLGSDIGGDVGAGVGGFLGGSSNQEEQDVGGRGRVVPGMRPTGAQPGAMRPTGG